MRSNFLKHFVWVSLFSCGTAFAQSTVIKFPEEELARESVLPKFKDKPMVLNRNVSVAKKLSIGGDIGITLNEPFNNPLQYGGFVNYHLDEAKAIHVFFNLLSSANSTYTDQLNSAPQTNFGLQYRPKPQFLLTGNFQYTAFYGKISLTKKFVMNLMLYGLGGGGIINIGGDSFPVLSVGLGQKFFFAKKLALRLDLRSIIYNGPNVVDHVPYQTRGSDVPSSEFGKALMLSNILTAGLEVLF